MDENFIKQCKTKIDTVTPEKPCDAMFCNCCHFHHSGCVWNRCDLTDSECYREFNLEPCPYINSAYIFKEDCAPLGFVKGESAIEFMKGDTE